MLRVSFIITGRSNHAGFVRFKLRTPRMIQSHASKIHRGVSWFHPSGEFFWRIEIAKPVRLGFHDLNIVFSFRVKRVPLCSDAVAEELPAVLVLVPI